MTAEEITENIVAAVTVLAAKAPKVMLPKPVVVGVRVHVLYSFPQESTSLISVGFACVSESARLKYCLPDSSYHLIFL